MSSETSDNAKEQETSMKNNNSSPAQDYVNNLLSEGAKVTCDDVSEGFRYHTALPPYYDEEEFKRLVYSLKLTQKFFYKHIFSFFFSKCLGLVSVLSIPSILKILIFTKMSGSEMTSYRRYLSTIFHMMIWYDSDFEPGSKLWRSIAEVRSLHNSASNRSCTAGLSRITQKDMALTQFGFMGFALVRSKMLGIHESSDNEWKAFLHLWRVIGYLMGIEERFNLCNGTVDEVRERCNILVEQIFRPNIERKDEDFINMSRYMINGLYSINIFIRFETVMCFLHILSQSDSSDRKMQSTHYPLDASQQSNLNFLVTVLSMLRWTWFRVFENYSHMLTLWIVKVFPIIAMYQFGITNARVRILSKNKSD
ncbi:hypothetical protein NQ315_006980 [Exocentrus adspersus]|uniref:ER-bound oxygenase mpaB/mpaB'/Rubber oxygenase catalytic domain-containing protein n=1 Tax=Exocentrus adspersus TaxID=1586481 RepID=A0AAV8WC75_9CUCU|nr:hypothetical protein NQ315_006980 [Exocentrus adspersus]